MEDASSSTSRKLDESTALALTGKIMVGIIIFLSLVVVFIFFLHLYLKWSRNRRREAAGDIHQQRTEVKVTKGLDPSILETIPVVVFDAKEFKDGTLECTICLCDVSEGEKTRLLPKCNHVFHVDCIDLWFQSHSTCPLCRNPMSTTLETTGKEAETSTSASTDLPVNFPTNVLFWGDETQVSTLCPSTASTSNTPHGMLAINFPGQVNDEEEEESKSAMPARFRRLMRLLSGNRSIDSSSPRNVDIEQGSRSPSLA